MAISAKSKILASDVSGIERVSAKSLTSSTPYSIQYNSGFAVIWGSLSVSATETKFTYPFWMSNVAITATHSGAVSGVNVITKAVTNTYCTFAHSYSDSATVSFIITGRWK